MNVLGWLLFFASELSERMNENGCLVPKVERLRYIDFTKPMWGSQVTSMGGSRMTVLVMVLVQ